MKQECYKRITKHEWDLFRNCYRPIIKSLKTEVRVRKNHIDLAKVLRLIEALEEYVEIWPFLSLDQKELLGDPPKGKRITPVRLIGSTDLRDHAKNS
jgi:hypothetical protein